MGDAFHFVPRAERDANHNLARFIRLAKEDLTVFGRGGAWESDRWQQGQTIVVFATKTAPLESYTFTPMAEPFKQFAKAYVRYRYSHRPVKSLATMLQALRCVESGLISACSRADIGLLTGAAMDACAEECRAFYASKDVQCNTGRHLQAIFDFVRDGRMVASLPAWKSPFKKPTILTEDLGPEGDAHRASKLPSTATMLLVADLFAQAVDPEGRYFTSMVILLMATPSRISEVLSLPTDCIHWEPDEQGVPQMYLRWRAAKGKRAMKKWVVPAMHDVVREAVRRLLEIGEPARQAARFAFKNPGRFMAHPGCLRNPGQEPDRPLMPDEFCGAVGVKCPRGGRLDDGSATWSQVVVDSRLKDLIKRGATTYGDLAGYVLETCGGDYWPFIDERRSLAPWDALCLHRHNEFHKEFDPKPFSWRLPRATEVNDRIGPIKGLSLFDRAGMKNPDGSSIKLTSHQLRHWLSTMCERAGMDQYTLAQWAGRARPADNRHYDHRSPEERLDAARQILPIETPSLLDRVKNRQPVTYQELGVERLGAAKVTLYGMCVHDYAMAPCQKQRECMTCKEHVCIKGDHVTLERIRLLEAQTELLLRQAQRAHVEGDFGADRWVDNHKWKLAHVRTMRMALERPDVPEGAVLSVPDGHDPSPVLRALMELEMVAVPRTETAELRAIPLSMA